MNTDAVKLGLMPPLTGLVGIYGTEIERAGQIACQEINESGGVLGRPLELVIEDDASLPESAVRAAEKLIDHHHCAAIIGNLLSNSRIAVAYRVAEPRKVPYLNFSFYEGSILSRYFFHFAALPNQQIDRMIPYMLRKFGPRMFFAGNNYEWPRGSIDAAKRALLRAGGTVVDEEYCPIGVTAEGLERLLDKVEAGAPDVFVPYFAGIDQVNLLTRFTERGLKKRMAVVMGHYDEMMASKLPPEVREGFYSSNTYFMTVDTAENTRYLKRLAAYPGVNGIWPAGNGILTNFGEGTYVCVKAFAQAANQAGSLDADALIDVLKTIHVRGPQGLVRMDPTTHHAKVNTFLSRCSADGVFAIVEKFDAIDPVLPERYNHQRISHQATLEDDIRLQARMLEQMSEGVLLIKADDETVVYANAGANRMYGYAADELIGQQLSKLMFSVNTSSSHDNSISSLVGQKGSWQGEIESRQKDGQAIWCSITISAFTHPVYGEVWMYVAGDISAHKKSEAELRTSTARLNEAQNIARLGSWTLDLTSGSLQWSDEVFRLFDINPQRFSGTYRDFYDAVHPDDRDMVDQAYTTHLATHQPYEITHRLRTPDGSIKWVYEKCHSEFDPLGKPLRSHGIVQDITERKIIEDELRNLNEELEARVAERTALLTIARDEADRANKAKSEFLSSMSHELRTPMNAILGFSQLMEMDAILPTEQKENAHQILMAGRHLLELINGVLDLAKIEAGHMELSMQPVEISSVIDECLTLLAPLATRHSLQIQASNITKAVLISDRMRLKQVLINLLSNAIKYNRPKGTVQLEVRPGDGERLLILVTDTGLGIPAERLKELFQPFNRLGIEHSNIEGTGIGLTITRRIAEMMGGSVNVKSQMGVGSTFWVELPWKPTDVMGGTH